MFSFHGPEVLTHKLKIEKLKELKDSEVYPSDKQLINVKNISFAPGTNLDSPMPSKDRRLISYNYGGQGPRFHTPKATHLVSSGQEAARISRLKFIHDRHYRKTDADGLKRDISAPVPTHGGKAGPSWLYRSKTTVDLTKYRDKNLNLGLMQAMEEGTERNIIPDVKMDVLGSETLERLATAPHDGVKAEQPVTALPNGTNTETVCLTGNITIDSGVASETSDQIFAENDLDDELEKFERKRFPPGGALRDRNSRVPPIGEVRFDIRDINEGSYVGNNHRFTNSLYSKGLATDRGSINRPHSPRMCLTERHIQSLRADPAAKHRIQRTHTLADFDKQRGRTYDLQARVKSFLNKS
jgi:hypothetical protein